MKKRIFAMLMAVIMVATLIAGAVPALAAEGGDITLRLHYHREDGQYTNENGPWEMWFWDPDAISDLNPPYSFVEENGEMVATIKLKTGTTNVGFIVRNGEWVDKDIQEDQFIDITGVLSGTLDFYVESGVKGGELKKGDDVTEGVVVTATSYKEENRNKKPEVTLQMSSELSYDVTTDTFKISNKDGQIGVASIRGAGQYFYLELAEALDLSRGYNVEFEGRIYALEMPDFYSSEKFESMFTYTGDDLGATYTKEKTSLRVWAPTAITVDVNLYKTGDKTVEKEPYETVYMTQDVNGTWVATLDGDMNGVYYTYVVTTDTDVNEACDPYARTTGVNGDRAMIIDLDSTDPAGWADDKNPHAGQKFVDAVIYELHVRDASMDASSGVSEANKGKYLGLIEAGTKTSGGVSTVLDHMVDLGVTHVHLLPVYDINSVDESKMDDPTANHYNWGYDPKNYNVPEGSYSTDAYNGEVRVKEFKQMVKGMHDAGLSVIMDVVYNHVADSRNFCVNRIVDGYFSRPDSNGSGCGNDTASERVMVRKYIVDSVNYWADEYHIDGFRFDLVGLLDVETINQIVETVHAKHPDVVFYGEGWTMGTKWTKAGTLGATQQNSGKTPNFAYFSDTVRNLIKGGTFGGINAGFISGGNAAPADLFSCFKGMPSWCSTPSQSINYISCHDNNTLYDHISIVKKDATEEQKAAMNKLGAAFVITAEGIPFFQAGEEFLRSKPNGDGTFNENSYNAGDEVNAIKWADLEKDLYKNVYEYYKGLIAFRKAHPALRLSTAAEVEANVTQLSGTPNGVGAYHINGGVNGETSEGIVAIFNANTSATNITLPEGNWVVYVNGEKAGTEALGNATGTVSVDASSAMILVKGEAVEPPVETTPNETTPNETTPGGSVEQPKDNGKLNTILIVGIVLGVLACVAVGFIAFKKK